MTIKHGNEEMNINLFLDKVRNYDISLSRSEIMDIVCNAKECNPKVLPLILDTVKNTYHLNLAV